MFESFTAGSLRALSRAEDRARERHSPVVELIDLAAGLADEPESRAAALATEFGLASEAILRALGRSAEPPAGDFETGKEPVDQPSRLPLAPTARGVLVAASSRAKGATARGSTIDRTAGTELCTYCPGRHTYANPLRRRNAIWLLVTCTETSPRLITASATAR